MPGVGFEPTRPYRTQDFKSRASANSATRASERGYRLEGSLTYSSVKIATHSTDIVETEVTRTEGKRNGITTL